jgi:hypothetical protein
MIDMNQSIESIMQECDYIAEVKGEAEVNYNRIRQHEYETGDHRDGNGKYYGRAIKNIRNGRMDSGKSLNGGNMRTADDYKMRRDIAKHAKEFGDEQISGHSKVREGNRKAYEKLHKESSIFDDLLDLV